MSKAIGNQKGPINGAASNRPYRQGEKPPVLRVDFYYRILLSFRYLLLTLGLILQKGSWQVLQLK